MMSYYDMAGLVGLTMGLYAYARVQLCRDYAKTLTYSMLNLGNATLLLLSITDTWNVTVFAGATFWLLFSIYGIYRCLKYDMLQDKLKAKEHRVMRVMH